MKPTIRRRSSSGCSLIMLWPQPGSPASQVFGRVSRDFEGVLRHGDTVEKAGDREHRRGSAHAPGFLGRRLAGLGLGGCNRRELAFARVLFGKTLVSGRVHQLRLQR